MEKSRNLQKRRQARRRRGRAEAAPAVEARRALHPLLRLQKQVGNAQVSRMLAQREDDLAWVRPEVGPEGGVLSNSLAARIQAKRGGGAPLDPARRTQMEGAFGTRLDDVRLHADQEADALNRSISARAFTIGSDIFFRREVDTNDPELLAHELAHVVQQRAMSSDGPLTVGPADDGLEREAQNVALGRQGVGTTATPNLAPGAPGGAASVQRGFFDDIVSGITGGGDGLMGTLGSIGSGISNVVGTITGGGGAADVAGSVGGGISDVGSSIGGGAGDVMGSIGGGVSDVASTIGGGGGVGDIVGSVSSGLGGMLGSLGQGGIGNMISSVGGGLGGMLGGGGGLGGMLGSLGSGLGGMLGGGGGLGGMLGSLGSGLGGMLGGGGGLGGMLGSLGGGLGGMLGSLGGGGGGILDSLFGR